MFCHNLEHGIYGVTQTDNDDNNDDDDGDNDNNNDVYNCNIYDIDIDIDDVSDDNDDCNDNLSPSFSHYISLSTIVSCCLLPIVSFPHTHTSIDFLPILTMICCMLHCIHKCRIFV